MGYYTFVDNAVPTSSQWNANFRDQVITQCTAATRPGSPVEGQCIYETDTDRLYYYSGAAWVIITEPIQTWTPTITQSSAVAGTVNRGWARRQNGLWEARLQWTSSAAGTAANAIVVTTPYTMSNASDAGGSFVYSDAGTVRVGVVRPNNTTSVIFSIENNAGSFGVAPAVTIASGDILFLSLFGTY